MLAREMGDGTSTDHASRTSYSASASRQLSFPPTGGRLYVVQCTARVSHDMFEQRPGIEQKEAGQLRRRANGGGMSARV